MNTTTETLDLTMTPPRSGRITLGRYAWLARLADKARSERAGKNGDYIAYCPLSMGFLERAGVARSAFEALIERGASDDELIDYFDKHVSDEQRNAANAYVLDESASHLDEQDSEEGRI